MAKIKLTKGELKRQRDSLRQYQHYLPTLQLKKQQLQIKILEARQLLAGKNAGLLKKEDEIGLWQGLLADPERGEGLTIADWVLPQGVVIDAFNIAGANVPILKEIAFPEARYDLYASAFWVDRGIAQLRDWIRLLIEIAVIKKQLAILEHELRITTQRVNLFEKIMIPECQDNIRKIRIYLGDQMANAVGISKVAKRKLVAVG